jgi:hypothetical protein
MPFAQDLTARFGGYLHLSVSTSAADAAKVSASIASRWPTARRVYLLAGVQHWQMPSSCEQLGSVFQGMQEIERGGGAKRVLSWSVSSTTLDQVFEMVVARAAANSTYCQ